VASIATLESAVSLTACKPSKIVSRLTSWHAAQEPFGQPIQATALSPMLGRADDARVESS
jgi:hypothetical protein